MADWLTAPLVCLPMLFPLTANVDMVAAESYLAVVAKHLPSNQAGSRFKRMFEGNKTPRTHHYFVLAGPYGSMLVAQMADIPDAQRLTYMRAFQV